MWWDKQTLLKESKVILKDKKFQGTSLFLGIANTMPEGMNINKVINDTTADTRHIRSILKLKSYFEQNKQNGLKFNSKYYNEDSHGSVPLITEYDALHFIFNFYPLKLTQKDFTDTTTALLDKFEKHYSAISKKMGFNVKLSEDQINSMGYEALGSKHFKKAERFFKYNIENYPESFNVYDSIGDYYDAIGDKPNTIKFYEKALSIKENPDTRKKLKIIQEKK
jgi:tetratricopeptide (TPR) repeat protein